MIFFIIADDLGDLVLAHQVTGEPGMTTIDTLEEAEAPFPVAGGARRSARAGRDFGDHWWRYLVSLLAIAFAFFPVAVGVSAAFNPVPSLSSASLIPDSVTLENFRRDPQRAPGIRREEQETPICRTRTGTSTRWWSPEQRRSSRSFFGALAAYAFSRFRFKGRRMGMLTLLLIQMFPTVPRRRRHLPDPAPDGEIFPA